MMTRSIYKTIIFDLDDTLYKEIDFVKSGFRAVTDFVSQPEAFDIIWKVWSIGGNAFQYLIDNYKLHYTIAELLSVYRNHFPSISLDLDVIQTLDSLSTRDINIGIISDGRSNTQRNKIKALKLGRWINSDNIVISEEIGSTKPSLENYEVIMKKFPNSKYCYVGDNLNKDFITPNLLGWQSICLKDDGRNIHHQNFDQEEIYLPKKIVYSLSEIL